MQSLDAAGWSLRLTDLWEITLSLQVGMDAERRSPKWGVNSKSGKNLQRGRGLHTQRLVPLVLAFVIDLYKFKI